MSFEAYAMEDLEAFDEFEYDGFDEFDGDGFEDLGEFEEYEEYEDDELEYLGEFEDDEFESLGEYEDDEFETLGEFEEYEGEYEGDLFSFGGLWKGIKKVGRVIAKGAKALAKGPLGAIFKKLAPIAARIVGGVIGGPIGAKIGGSIASAILKEAAYESEGEAEAEMFEGEYEYESLGGDLEAYELMEAYAEGVAEAESEVEANQHLLRMVLQTRRMFRRNPAVRSAIPHVSRAAAALVKTFRVNRKTRWAIKAIPLIVQRTLTRLARMRRFSRQDIVKAMATETAWVLANRQRAMAALRKHRSASRRPGVRRGRPGVPHRRVRRVAPMPR